MKHTILSYYFLLAVICVSCYEGEDIAQTYSLYGQDQTIAFEASNVTLTTAKVSVALTNPKYQSHIDIYYSDQPDADLLKVGEKQSFVVGDANQILATEKQFTLNGLMPDTKYRYIAVYMDVSGKEYKTEEKSFHTPAFQMISKLSSETYFSCSVYTSFDNMIAGAEAGYLYGRERNLTVENAEGNVAVDYDGGQYASCYEEISDLQPDTDYYLRPYLTYKGRVYYGSVETDHTPKIEIEFHNIESQLVSAQQVTLSSRAVLQNLSLYNTYILPQFEYGMLVSTQPGVTFDNATIHVIEPDWLGDITYEMTDAKPSVVYYVRAYVKWKEQIFLSQESSFCLPKDKLSGDVDSLYINGQMIRFVLVKAGTFTMGATDEQTTYARSDEYPVHQVTISSDYYISELEITNAMFGVSDNHNPVRPTWHQANQFAEQVSTLTGITAVSLPTEAEWEYAARGGHKHPAQTLFAGSNDPDLVAWVNDNPLTEGYYGKVLPAINMGGQKQPNALGIYDMCGNVAEWCSDAYHSGYYSVSPTVDPRCDIDEWEEAGYYARTQQRVVRGGGARTEWVNMSLIDYRVSARTFGNQGDGGFGFRLVIRNN